MRALGSVTSTVVNTGCLSKRVKCRCNYATVPDHLATLWSRDFTIYAASEAKSRFAASKAESKFICIHRSLAFKEGAAYVNIHRATRGRKERSQVSQVDCLVVTNASENFSSSSSQRLSDSVEQRRCSRGSLSFTVSELLSLSRLSSPRQQPVKQVGKIFIQLHHLQSIWTVGKQVGN